MIKVVCRKDSNISRALAEGSICFAEYAQSVTPNVGRFGVGFREDVRLRGIVPDIKLWDFVTIALSACAADESIERWHNSIDGWTRQIDLTVALCQPEIWMSQIGRIEQLLRFLTGDFWSLHFEDDGVPPPSPSRMGQYDVDCVSLLSGGMDSLIGSIDLVSEGRRPLFLSHTVRDNKEEQIYFARCLRGASPQFMWNRAVKSPGCISETEPSTRSRSIAFFAFAALATAVIPEDFGIRKQIFVAENGFISLNVPLDPARIGSLSTKTTHPVYMGMLQQLWDAVGIGIDLVLKYKFMTKGEMVAACQNQDMFRRLVWVSTSCGRFGHYNRQHCGRCVPCLVRRAAFMKNNLEDDTKNGYHFFELDHSTDEIDVIHEDLGAMTLACAETFRSGFSGRVASYFAFADAQERSGYQGVYERGLIEVRDFLQAKGVL